MTASWRIERLSRSHERRYFGCGEATLDEYLTRLARQNDESGVARTFVAVEPDIPRRVIGYYSISAGAIDRENLPPRAAKRLPRLAIPIARLTRLAVDQAFQGEGLGEYLLIDALRRVLLAAADSAMVALMLDAESQKGKRFYARYGFDRLLDQPRLLWLPMAAIDKLFQNARPARR